MPKLSARTMDTAALERLATNLLAAVPEDMTTEQACVFWAAALRARVSDPRTLHELHGVLDGIEADAARAYGDWPSDDAPSDDDEEPTRGVRGP